MYDVTRERADMYDDTDEMDTNYGEICAMQLGVKVVIYGMLLS